MKTAIIAGGLLALGAVAWQIGARLSTDAIGMGVGLIFGVLSGIPTALLVLAAGGRRQGDRYEQGYEDGRRAAQLDELQREAQRLLERQSRELQRHAVIVVNPPADIDDDLDAFSHAYPFGRQFRITGEVER